MRPDPDRDRPERRGERLRQPVGHGPSAPAPGGHGPRRSRAADARGVHDARVPGRGHGAHRARPDGRQRRAPDARPAGQGRDDAGRARGRSTDLLRGRRRLVRARGDRAGPAVPAPRRAFRAARGDAPDRAGDVRRRPDTDRRPPPSTRGADQRAAHRCRGRGSWSAAGASARRSGWWPSTPTRATSSSPIPARAATSSRCSPAIARRSAGTRPRSRRPRCSRRTCGRGTRRRLTCVAAFRAQADEGIEHVIVNLPDAHVLERLDVFGREIVPAVA